MKPERLLLEIEDIIQNHGYKIIHEKGNFKSDHCILEGDNLVVLNKLHPPEFQIGILIKLIYDRKMNNQFIKPKVREELERLWKQTTYYNPDIFEFEEV